jgi:hypothetical protein
MPFRHAVPEIFELKYSENKRVSTKCPCICKTKTEREWHRKQGVFGKFFQKKSYEFVFGITWKLLVIFLLNFAPIKVFLIGYHFKRFQREN